MIRMAVDLMTENSGGMQDRRRVGKEIAGKIHQILPKSQVDVFIKEYRSVTAAIIGMAY